MQQDKVKKDQKTVLSVWEEKSISLPGLACMVSVWAEGRIHPSILGNALMKGATSQLACMVSVWDGQDYPGRN